MLNSDQPPSTENNALPPISVHSQPLLCVENPRLTQSLPKIEMKLSPQSTVLCSLRKFARPAPAQASYGPWVVLTEAEGSHGLAVPEQPYPNLEVLILKQNGNVTASKLVQCRDWRRVPAGQDDFRLKTGNLPSPRLHTRESTKQCVLNAVTP